MSKKPKGQRVHYFLTKIVFSAPVSAKAAQYEARVHLPGDYLTHEYLEHGAETMNVRTVRRVPLKSGRLP